MALAGALSQMLLPATGITNKSLRALMTGLLHELPGDFGPVSQLRCRGFGSRGCAQQMGRSASPSRVARRIAGEV